VPEFATLFSFQITELTADERDWLAPLTGADGAGPTDELAALLTNPDQIGFYATFADDGRALSVESGEHGTPEDAANILQAFLSRFRPDGTFGFEWAKTCSQPLPDAFGGGAVFITARGQRWTSSGNWLADQQRPARTRPAGGSVVDDESVSTREEGYYVVVCTDDPDRTWVLARTLDDDRSPFFFQAEQAERIAAEINAAVAGTSATVAEWFAADTVTGRDDFDVIVRAVYGTEG
jgi:hypothetical protein